MSVFRREESATPLLRTTRVGEMALKTGSRAAPRCS